MEFKFTFFLNMFLFKCICQFNYFTFDYIFYLMSFLFYFMCNLYFLNLTLQFFSFNHKI